MPLCAWSCVVQMQSPAVLDAMSSTLKQECDAVNGSDVIERLLMMANDGVTKMRKISAKNYVFAGNSANSSVAHALAVAIHSVYAFIGNDSSIISEKIKRKVIDTKNF